MTPAGRAAGRGSLFRWGARKIGRPRPFVKCCVTPAVIVPNPDGIPSTDALRSQPSPAAVARLRARVRAWAATMRWIRSNVRLGAWCALFALAFQLALSFGHVHVDAGRSTSPATVLAADFAAAEIPPGPSSDEPKGQAGDFCAVCALIQLAGSVAPAAAPSLALPAAFAAVAFDRSPGSEITASSPLFFQARAPPLV